MIVFCNFISSRFFCQDKISVSQILDNKLTKRFLNFERSEKEEENVVEKDFLIRLLLR